MKNFFGLLLIVIFLSCDSTKQVTPQVVVPPISTGVVLYDISIEAEEEMDAEGFGTKAQATFSPSTIHFAKLDGLSKGASFQLIDGKTGVETNYLSFRNKKFALISDSTMLPPLGDFVFSSEKKNIAGFECTKAIAKMGDDQLVAWFTSELGVNFCPYVQAKGFALEYTLAMPYGKVTYSATAVERKEIDDQFFIPSEEYKLVTLEELQQEAMGSAQRSFIPIGADVPTFAQSDMSGKLVDLEKLKGKVVVLNFWFINCPPCRLEMPDLNELKAEYASKDVEFIAITFDQKNEVKSFLEKMTFDFQIIPNARDIIEEYGIRAFPTSIILNKNGKVVNSKMGGGMNIKEELKVFIEEGLSE